MGEISESKAIRSKKGKKFWVITIFLSVVFVLFMWKGLPVLAGTNCTAPTGYQEIGRVNAIDMDGNEFWIAKAIVPTGKDNGGVSVRISGCTTTEKILIPFGGIYVYIENNLIYIETGLKGVILPLKGTPQP